LWYHAFIKTLYKRDETVATPRVLELLMSAGGFARTSVTDQRNRLVEYYRDWFAGDYKVHTIDNIRATQRLSVHAKAMNAPVGTVLLVILEEASGLGATQPVSAVSTDTHVSGRGLLDVEACPVTHQGEDVPVETDMVVTVGGTTPEPMTDTPTPPAQGGPKTRSKRAK